MFHVLIKENSAMTNELLPCPFCGGEAKSCDGLAPTPNIELVWCSNPDCALYEEEIVLKKWNTRTQQVGESVFEVHHIEFQGQQVLLFSDEDKERLEKLPNGTKLYTHPRRVR